MLAHDVSDIFMETAKLFNYAQKRYPWCHVSSHRNALGMPVARCHRFFSPGGYSTPMQSQLGPPQNVAPFHLACPYQKV